MQILEAKKKDINSLSKLAEKLAEYHLKFDDFYKGAKEQRKDFKKLLLKKKWIYVDATWDPKLEKTGFPITKNWNGKSDTKFAVLPKEIIELKRAPPKQIKRPENREFYEALNKWLESKRAN